MTYQQQPPPVMPGPDPSASWASPPAAPPPAKSKLVPVLLGIIVVLLVAVGGLAFALLRSNDSGSPGGNAAVHGADFTQIKTDCNAVAGYAIEDAGKTLVITVGGAFMNTDTAGCVFDKLGTPDAVRQHVSTTRALDGQQTDSWPGYTARWTYHPDDGLQMTIRAA